MKYLALASIIMLGACEVTDGANGAQIAYGTSVWQQFNCQQKELSTIVYTDDHCESGQSCIWQKNLVERAYWCAGDVQGEFLRDDVIEIIEACGFTVETELNYQAYLDPMGHDLSRDFNADFLIMTGGVPLHDHESGEMLNFDSPAGFVFRAKDSAKLSDCDM